ncbi:flippase [Aeromonas caviae]|nr:flippase [Aeromonas caviae]
MFSLGVLQLFMYVIPLLTTPYLVRVLGAEGFGKIAIASAVITFLGIMTDYGFNLSATRSISVNRDNVEKISEIYSCVFTIKCILLMLSFSILMIYLFFINEGLVIRDRLLYVFSFGQVIGQVLLPLWLYQGLEQMKIITKINLFIRLFFLLMIFFVIKNDHDYYIVPLITSLGSIFGGVWAIWYVKYKLEIKLTKPKLPVMKVYLYEGFSFFGIAASSTILASSSLLFLGFYTNQETVGVYSAIERIVKAVQSLFSPITQAFFPYISRLFLVSKEQAVNEIKKLIYILSTCVLLLLLIINFMSNDIIFLFYGEKYEKYSYIFLLLSPWFFLGILNNVLGCQLLTAIGRGGLYFKMFIIASVSTIVLFIFLIPQYGINGVPYAMSLGEFILFILLSISSKFIFKQFLGSCYGKN